VNWQPISQMPFVAGMIDGALGDTRGHVQTLTGARAEPHVLDDATIDRIERVHREQLEFVDIYAEQILRWRTQGPSAAQTLELDRLETQNRRLRQVTTDVLALAHELRKGTHRGHERPRSRAAGRLRNPTIARDVSSTVIDGRAPRTRLRAAHHAQGGGRLGTLARDRPVAQDTRLGTMSLVTCGAGLFANSS
jgi:hypothetical protein